MKVDKNIYFCALLFRDLLNRYENVASTVLGWGSKKLKGPATDKLMEAQVITQPAYKCGLLAKKITDRMMCAFDDGQDTCHGDSGGKILGIITLKILSIHFFLIFRAVVYH